MPLTTGDIDAVCDLIHDLCGICLDSSKSYLIESRLGQIVEKYGCQDYAELVKKVRQGSDVLLTNQVVDAITTNETLFFRDNYMFEALRHKALPELIDARQKTAFPTRIRIWSAACSTGQEPYSLAMTLAELIPDVNRWDIQIMATDISDTVIAKASRGSYAKHEIERGISPERLHRFFVPDGNGWKIKDEIRANGGVRQEEPDATARSFGALRHGVLPQRGDLLHTRSPARLVPQDCRHDGPGRILVRRSARVSGGRGFYLRAASSLPRDLLSAEHGASDSRNTGQELAALR